MAKSAYVDRLDEVQASIATLLKPIGFRKKGRTFNRSAEEGVVQVVNLQSGQFPIGEDKPLPSELAHLRPNLYGKFAVNLGVHVKEIWECEQRGRHPSFIQDYDCAIRTRLGRRSEGKEYWWSLDAPAASIVNDMSPPLLDEGMAFLKRFETRNAILADWISLNDGPERLSARARVDIAIILERCGDKTGASRLLREQIERSPVKGHHDYVRRLASELDLDV
jgi:hypothetical protein